MPERFIGPMTINTCGRIKGMPRNRCFILICSFLLLGIAGCSNSQGEAGKSTNNPVDTSLSPEDQVLEAADNGNLKVLCSLIEKDPGLATVANDALETPLHLLLQHRNWDTKTITLLVKNGNDPNEKNARGQSPLDIADENLAPPEIMQLLREGHSTDAAK